MKAKILMIVGSVRKDSLNLQLAQKAAELLGERAEVSFLQYADIPFMNQDIEAPAPEAVARIRAEVMAADGLWFFSPEYNHCFSGVLKNLLDWLSRPLVAGNYASGTALAGKKAAISGAAGSSAAAHSRAQLKALLGFIRVKAMEEETGVAMNAETFKTGVLALSEENAAQLRHQADAFLKYLAE